MAWHIIHIFVLGWTSAYFFILGLRLLTPGRSRLLHIMGYIYLWWMANSLKDILLPLSDWNNVSVLRAIYLADGFSVLTIIALFMEILTPRWITLRRLLMLCVPMVFMNIGGIGIKSEWYLWVYTAYLVIITLYYIRIAVRKMTRYDIYLKTYYSNFEALDVSWLWKVFWLFVTMQVLWLFISIINLPWFDIVYYISTVVVWHITLLQIRRINYAQQSAIQQQMDDECNEQQAQALCTEAKEYHFAGKLEEMIADEQLYLNPDLSVADLVTRLGTNRTYISAYFTGVLNTTFYEYINQLRIRQGCLPLMSSHPEYTIESISELSGFKSLSTFRRAFTKEMGMSPLAYRQEQASQGE